MDHRLEYAHEETYVPPMFLDPDYDGVSAMPETHGLMVIHFLCDPPDPL